MTSNKRKVTSVCMDIVLMAVLVLIDQITKKLAIKHLKDKPDINLINGVFELKYLENRGAAFGMMQNQKVLFIIMAAIMLFVVMYILIKLPDSKRHIPLEICMIMIGAGAIGNLVDRCINTYVVDFFYFVLINFPIFNVADIYVTVSCAILIIVVLFVYKEEDLAFLRIKKDNGTV